MKGRRQQALFLLLLIIFPLQLALLRETRWLPYQAQNSSGLSFWEANRWCESKGGALAVIKSRRELENFRKTLLSFSAHKVQGFWIGLKNESKHNQKYKWLDGTILRLNKGLKWAEGHPKNSPDPSCVVVKTLVDPGKVEMYAKSCTESNINWVCEKQKNFMHQRNGSKRSTTTAAPDLSITAKVFIISLILFGLAALYFWYRRSREKEEEKEQEKKEKKLKREKERKERKRRAKKRKSDSQQYYYGPDGLVMVQAPTQVVELLQEPMQLQEFY